ncbi:MAG: hypothetical protein HYT76_06730 [Deltaproteobacteria bacterium]|nr:hypothetical protein [Deltaproteobacteria bacterium]
MKTHRMLIVLGLFASFSCSSSQYIYRSPNRLDYVRLAKAKGAEKEGLRHPHRFEPDKIREVLRSIRFNKKALIQREVMEEHLFEERHIEFLTPYLIEAFQKATADQVVVASYFTQRRKWGLTDDRLTIFRAYLKEDGFHLRFEKLYAKMLGDRTTKGTERVIHEARGMRVSLEVQPGQDRISWDPEELVIHLDSRPKTQKETKGDHEDDEEVQKTKVKIKTVRERLKELERMKEEELITEKEYQKKRKELLREL